AVAGDPLRRRLGAVGHHARRPDRARLGRARPPVPVPPRHLQRQLARALRGTAAIRDLRPLDEPRGSGPALARRVMAPQPPRVPALRAAWAALVRAGRLGAGDPPAGMRRPSLERGADIARASGAEACRLMPDAAHTLD